MQYYADGAKDGGFESGIRSGITGMLASPFFLYRGERVPAGMKPGEKYQITDLELASKLSFFLWNSIPDDELLNLASKNKLSDPATLNMQVKRMLADSRSRTLASDFVFQWLDMYKLDEIVPDRDVFPYASGFMDPRQDFRTELRLFSDSIFREDHSVVDLLRSSHTYVNERLALQYGINDVKGDEFRRVELKDSARWGLLGKGAVLMAAVLAVVDPAELAVLVPPAFGVQAARQGRLDKLVDVLFADDVGAHAAASARSASRMV